MPSALPNELHAQLKNLTVFEVVLRILGPHGDSCSSQPSPKLQHRLDTTPLMHPTSPRGQLFSHIFDSLCAWTALMVPMASGVSKPISQSQACSKYHITKAQGGCNHREQG